MKTIHDLLISEYSIPKHEIEIILAHILNKKRNELYFIREHRLSKPEVELFNDILENRKANQPLQYLLGSTEFYGYTFSVNESVLVPRPETELLVEKTIQKIKTKHYSLPILGIELGVGSGAISISLLKELPNLKMIAFDISRRALETAKHNAIINNVDERLFLCHADSFDFISPKHRLDFIISNPPYLPRSDIQTMPKDVLNEPHIALFSKAPNEFYSLCLEAIKNGLLAREGFFIAEGDPRYLNSIAEEFRAENIFKNINIIKDLTDKDRILEIDL